MYVMLLGILHILSASSHCPPSTMYAPQGNQRRPSGAPSMSSQMSLDNAHQDMTSAYPMQGQMRGTARPDQSPLTNFSRDGLPVDVFGPTGLQGIQRREQSMAVSTSVKAKVKQNKLLTSLDYSPIPHVHLTLRTLHCTHTWLLRRHHPEHICTSHLRKISIIQISHHREGLLTLDIHLAPCFLMETLHRAQGQLNRKVALRMIAFNHCTQRTAITTR